MTERMSWAGDERLHQPRIHSLRIRQLYQVSVDSKTPMTVLADQAIKRFVREYNEPMDTFETKMERLASGVEYFNLQRTEEGWLLSFVYGEGETFEEESKVLNSLISKASSVAFSSEEPHEASEYQAPPSPENP